jgi:hypothetical protein
MEPKEVFQRFEKSLNEFLRSDNFLLEVRVNERAISHKLAEHIQSQFPEWNVDCEYNRVKYDFKKVKGKLVNPDIIVHHRNTFVNLLVVEVKKSGNKKGIKKDIERLEIFTKDSIIYKVGILVVFNKMNTITKFFQNGKEVNVEKS